MGALLAFILLTLLIFGAGFAMDILWTIAVVMFLVWIVGFVVRGAERTWYRW